MPARLPNFGLIVARLVCLCLIAGLPFAVQATGDNDYVLQPGDVVNVSIWCEPDLDRTLLVRPYGGISFPLAGELQAAGNSVAQLGQSSAACCFP